MSPRQRLWDALYAMAEPFIKMPESNMVAFGVVFTELFFTLIALRLGVDGRIVIGTVFGSMFATAIAHYRFYDSSRFPRP
jgi:hypothetical protein